MLASFLVLGLALPASARNAGGKFKVVTTFTVVADLAKNVAGDAAIVESITKPNAEIHNYQPTPGDILRAQDADLVIWNGLNLERWFEKFFRNLRARRARTRNTARVTSAAWAASPVRRSAEE